MNATRNILIITVICAMAVPSIADWDPGDDFKMHWPQLPDLNTTGMDVLSIYPYPSPVGPVAKILADDFECTETGSITDIHIWGSWLNDFYPFNNGDGFQDPFQDPSAVSFKLSIHSDIPAVIGADGTVLEHSRPGDLLWEDFFVPGDPRWKTRLYAAPVQELFYDPNANQIIGEDTEVWQYNFDIDPATAFVQKGTATNPVVYWLDVLAIPDELPGVPQALWGWKTSRDHWNDDAVFGDTTDPFGVPDEWFEMVYPSEHPLAGESIDLAFVITPEPATMAMLGLGSLGLLLRRRRCK